MLLRQHRNTKRLIVAVKLNAVGSPPVGPTKPVWEMSIASDPNEGPTKPTNPAPAGAAPACHLGAELLSV